MASRKNNIKTSTNAVLYLRVSTEEQAKDAYGLESQEHECRRFCSDQKWNVIRVFKDAGISGWADVERPQFNAMILWLETTRDANLVFYDFSRFGRDTLKALQKFQTLDRWGILSIAATTPWIDCRTAAGRAGRRTELNKAEEFSDQNSERTTARMLAAFEEGRYCRRAPLGYRNTLFKSKGQPNIEPDEREAELVRKSFELVAEGNSRPADILRHVSALGLHSKKGNKLDLNTFLKMLRNPVYIGNISSKKWRKTVKGLHQPIVDQLVFTNVQRVLSGKKPIAAPYQRNHEEFPLRRFLRCACCGGRLTGGKSKSETGKLYAYYNCYQCRKVKSLCTQKAHDEFVRLLERLKPSLLLLSEIPSVLKEEWEKRAGDNSAKSARLQIELNGKTCLKRKLLEKYILNDPNVVSIFEQMDAKFNEEITEIKAQIAEAEMERATVEELIEFSRTVLVDISAVWSRADLSAKQRVQNTLFPRGLEYHPQRGILNSNNDCLFNQLEGMLWGKENLVRPERFELPT